MAKTAKTKQTREDDMATESAKMMRQMFGQAGSLPDNFNALSRANMEAMTQSLQASSKGFNQMGTQLMGYMQDNLRRNFETARTLSTVKSLEDLTALTDATKAGFEAYIGQMNALSSLFATTLKDASEPLSAQAGAIVEHFQATA